MTIAEEAMDTTISVAGGVACAAVGYVAADSVDRFLASYDPSAAEKPKDKFTSVGGAGTLPNCLNVSSAPGVARVAAGVGMVGVSAVAAAAVSDPLGKSALEGFAVGAGISFAKTMWNNVLMPMLIGKDTSVPALQKSVIARLYPAETAAHINRHQSPPLTSVSSSGSGALSSPQLPAGVADPLYPDAQQAIAAGLHGDSPYDDTGRALRRAAGLYGPSMYDDTAEALRRATGLSDAAAAPAVAAIANAVKQAIPDVHPAKAVEAAAAAVAQPHDVGGAIQRVLPGAHPAAVGHVVRAALPHVVRAHSWQPGPSGDGGTGPTTTQPSETQCGCGATDFYFLGDAPAEASEPLFGIGDFARHVAAKLDPGDHSLRR